MILFYEKKKRQPITLDSKTLETHWILPSFDSYLPNGGPLGWAPSVWQGPSPGPPRPAPGWVKEGWRLHVPHHPWRLLLPLPCSAPNVLRLKQELGSPGGSRTMYSMLVQLVVWVSCSSQNHTPRSSESLWENQGVKFGQRDAQQPSWLVLNFAMKDVSSRPLSVALRLPLLVGNHDLTWKCALCCPQNRGNNSLETSWVRSVV